MIDGTALCRVVDGSVEQCTTLTNELVTISSLDGDVLTGVTFTLIPFIIGIGAGAVYKMLMMNSKF